MVCKHLLTKTVCMLHMYFESCFKPFLFECQFIFTTQNSLKVEDNERDMYVIKYTLAIPTKRIIATVIVITATAVWTLLIVDITRQKSELYVVNS